MRYTPVLIVSALLLSIGSACGQDPPREHEGHLGPMGGGAPQGHGHGMMGMSPGMMPGTPAMLLQARETLGLDESQVQGLEALQEQIEPTLRAHMTTMMQAHQELAGIIQGDAFDHSQYEATVRQAGEHWVEAHLAVASAMVRAQEILTEEQRQQLRTGTGMMLDMMPHMHGGGPGPGGGMMHEPRTDAP